MFNYVIVPSTGSELDRPIVEMALSATNPSSAHLVFLHVRMDLKQMTVMLAGSGSTLGTGLVGLEQAAGERERCAHENFHAFCSEYQLAAKATPGVGRSASWNTVTGEEAVSFAKQARTADAIVLGRGKRDEPLSPEVLTRTLMHSGRPVLIAPSGQLPERLGRTIAIAWKDRPEAARAVTAAMPLITAAERIVILSLSEEEGDADESCESLRQSLSWHNANVSLQPLPCNGRDSPRILMEAAAGPGVAASLLVMGGYGHTRLREAILGGFTRHVLAGAEIPVLMVH
jgi:nucleotide-binding universal stress UspA family protein